MKAILIGYGYWGKKLFPILQKFGEVVVVDSNPVATSDQLMIQKNLDESLNNPTITHVFIATPEETHYELVKKCLAAGKHVFVEKPLALSSKEARELVELAIRCQKCVYVDYIFLFDPAVKKIRKIIQQKKLGQLKKFTSVRKSAGFFKPRITVFDDLAPHDIYLFPFLFETGIVSVKRLTAFAEQGTISKGTVEYLLENHLEALAEYAWTKDESERVITIEGRLGKLIWKRGVEEDFVHQIVPDGTVKSIRIVNSLSPLQQSLEHFLHLSEYEQEGQRQHQYQQYIADVAVLESIRDANSTL